MLIKIIFRHIKNPPKIVKEIRPTCKMFAFFIVGHADWNKARKLVRIITEILKQN